MKSLSPNGNDFATIAWTIALIALAIVVLHNTVNPTTKQATNKIERKYQSWLQK